MGSWLPPIIASAVTLFLGVLGVVINQRIVRAQQSVEATKNDSLTRIEEWDRLLKNCRTESDRRQQESNDLAREVNWYRERHGPIDPGQREPG